MKKSLIAASVAFILGCYGTQDRHGGTVQTSYELVSLVKNLDSATDGVNIGLVWMTNPGDGRISQLAIFNDVGDISEGPYKLLTSAEPHRFSENPRVFWEGGSYLIIWSEDSPEERSLFMKRHHPGESWSMDDVQVVDVGDHFIQTSSVYLFESEIVVTWRDSRLGEESPMAYGAIFDLEGNRLSDDIFLGEGSMRSYETRAAKHGSTIAFVVAMYAADDTARIGFRTYDTSSGELSVISFLVDSPPATPREFWVEDSMLRLVYNSYLDEGTNEAREIRLDLEGNVLEGPGAFGNDPILAKAISVAFDQDATVLNWVEQENENPGTLYLTRAEEEIYVLDLDYLAHSTTLVATDSRLVSIWSDDQPSIQFLSIPR